MRHKWIHLLFGGLMVMTLASCSSALSSPPGDAGTIPPLDTSVDKPMAVSPTAVPAVESRPPESGAQQQTAVPITRTQSGGTQEPPIMSGIPISIPLEPALQQVVIQAREDLARRLGVPVDSVTVDAVIGQEFSTDAFYCRTSKDRISKDVSPLVMSGQSILLSASAHRYEYHASGPTVIFCRPLL
jgi:hypothetical protein